MTTELTPAAPTIIWATVRRPLRHTPHGIMLVIGAPPEAGAAFVDWFRTGSSIFMATEVIGSPDGIIGLVAHHEPTARMYRSLRQHAREALGAGVRYLRASQILALQGGHDDSVSIEQPHLVSAAITQASSRKEAVRLRVYANATSPELHDVQFAPPRPLPSVTEITRLSLTSGEIWLGVSPCPLLIDDHNPIAD